MTEALPTKTVEERLQMIAIYPAVLIVAHHVSRKV